MTGTLFASAAQQHLPAEALGRVTSFGALGAFVLGPLGLAAAGPVAARTGVTAVLAFGLVWQLAACAVVLTLPAVRNLRAPRSVRPAAGARVGSPP